MNANDSRTPKIEYIVKRGNLKGGVHTPHRYADGCYVVSKTRFAEDQIRVSSLSEVLEYLQKGFKVRVSDPSHPSSPSLVGLDSLKIEHGRPEASTGTIA